MAGGDRGPVPVAVQRSWMEPRPGFYACYCSVRVGPGSKLANVGEALQDMLRSGVPPDAQIYINGEHVNASWQETTR